MSYMRWTSKSTGKFATESVRQGYKITADTVGRILKSGADVPRPLGVGLERVTEAVQQTQHRALRDFEALVHQFCCQLRRRLRRPAQLRHGVSPSLGIHQFVEGLEQAGLGVGQRLVPPDREYVQYQARPCDL